MNISSLREFIVSVPTCRETDTCAEIWLQFQQSASEALLVVNQRNLPLGFLRLGRFITIFPGSIPTESRAQADLLQNYLAAGDLLEPVRLVQADLADIADLLPLIEPIPAGRQVEMPVETPVETQSNTPLFPASPIAVIAVDAAGQMVGRLDTARLLTLYRSESQFEQGYGFEGYGFEGYGFEGYGVAHTPAQLPNQISGQMPVQTSASVLEPIPLPLIDLIERLPLPLMLQTSAGLIISQNLAWRQQVGAIEHPQQIRRAAAQILEAALSCPTDEKQSSGSNSNWSNSNWSSTALPLVGTSPTEPNTRIPELNLTEPSQDGFTQSQFPQAVCHFGTEPNTCVCVCPMKNGQERVWQFIKIPMGTSTMPQSASGLTSDLTSDLNGAASQTDLPFKLASLKFSPTPNWQALIQTEQLWLIWAQDMTEQQQISKELAARNADLIQLNRLKDEFLACISHELKTPLTAVLGMSSLLKDHLIGDLNERQSHYAQLIYRGGRHLIAIVNNILDLTRTETGQLELLLEQLHIPTLCQQAYEQARQLIETEATQDISDLAQSFHLEIQPDLQHIVADELRLKQMLINLLSNAIKFTDPGRELGLRVEDWEGWIAFTVWDTGIGIPADKQHLIFQKFQQLENPLTRQFQGTGLGLVLTQHLARLHGGEVTFTSTFGQGSQFTLLMPPLPPQASAANFDLEPAKSQRLPSPQRPTSQRLTTVADRNRLVLIVEADADHLQERVEQLIELGYRAVVSRSGTEAIEKARRLQPAAILLNPALPQLSGWDVLTLLKADPTTQAIPLVVTSVRVQKDQAYQNGADGFLSLPLENAALKRCLDRIIRPEPNLPHSDLTVLHLYEGNPSLSLVAQQPLTQGLNHLLHPYHCRVLEVDDLEQADLLARVWKPDVVLIDQVQNDPYSFAQWLSRSALARLPLITLTPTLTQALNQIPELSVFPYLAFVTEEPLPHQPDQTQPDQTQPDQTLGRTEPAIEPNVEPNIAELVQIMQLAAGVSWIPHVLIVDCAGIDLNLPYSSSQSSGQPSGTTAAIRPPVRALVQYLQTAGFRSAIDSDWAKILQKLNQQSVDLLLLCVSSDQPATLTEQIVQTLEKLPSRPPILVWNYHHPTPAPTQRHNLPDATALADSTQWHSITAQVLPASVSILELLAQINQTLAERQR
jgi:signal transduction histidine kinase/CheY-like chemotaxis protein